MTSFLSPRAIAVIFVTFISAQNADAEVRIRSNPIVGHVCAVANFGKSAKVLCEKGAASLLKTESEDLQLSYRAPTKEAFGVYLLSQKREDDELASAVLGRFQAGWDICARDLVCNQTISDFFPSGIANCSMYSSVADVEVLLTLGGRASPVSNFGIAVFCDRANVLTILVDSKLNPSFGDRKGRSDGSKMDVLYMITFPEKLSNG